MSPAELLTLKFIALKIENYFDYGYPNQLELDFDRLLYQPKYFPSIQTWYLRQILVFCRKNNINIDRILVMNQPKLTQKQLETIKKKDELFYKVVTNKLDLEDLNKIVDSYPKKEYADSLVRSLFLVLDVKKASEDVLIQIADRIAFVTDEFLTERENPMELGGNYYSYRFQKKNFLNSITRMYDQFGPNFWLTNVEHRHFLGLDGKKVRFLETLLCLEREGIIRIFAVEMTNIEQDGKIAQLVAVQVRLNQLNSLPAGDSNRGLLLPTQPPPGWALIKEGLGAHLSYQNQIIFTFPTVTSRKFKYFKYLWEHYGQVVRYEELFKISSDETTKNGKNAGTNKLVRTEMIVLRKEFRTKKVPITLENSAGVKVTIDQNSEFFKK